MDLHPYLLELTVSFEQEGINIRTMDAEYGHIAWKLDEDVLFCKGDSPEEEWERFPDLEMPAGGDAAIALENDIANVVRAIFAALQP